MYKKRLKVGDIIIVSNILFGLREYEVLKIEGNKAYTKFRTFNTKVYYGKAVYEYGKRYNPDSPVNYYIKNNQN